MHRGVFDEIYLWFLLVGHTHEDIDAIFGKISMHLKGRNFFSMEKMGDFISESITSTPVHFEEITKVGPLLFPSDSPSCLSAY